jgi:hypothetical protein
MKHRSPAAHARPRPVSGSRRRAAARSSRRRTIRRDASRINPDGTRSSDAQEDAMGLQSTRRALGPAEPRPPVRHGAHETATATARRPNDKSEVCGSRHTPRTRSRTAKQALRPLPVNCCPTASCIAGLRASRRGIVVALAGHQRAGHQHSTTSVSLASMLCSTACAERSARGALWT